MKLVTLLVLVVIAATLCNAENAFDKRRPKFSLAESPFQNFLKSKWRSYVTSIISEGVAKLALKLDQKLEEMKATRVQNVIFSPYSLYNTLALTLLASRDGTYREITNLLSLDSRVDISRNSEVVHRLLNQMIEEYQEMRRLDQEIPCCKLFSSIFMQKDLPLRDKFSNIVKQTYKCDMTHVDFMNNHEGSKRTIENWLRTAVGVGNEDFSFLIPKSTNVTIFSTMQFRGQWNHQFKIDGTHRGLFYTGPDEQVSVEMMSQFMMTPFIESKELGLKMVGLPYKGSEVVMYVILPHTIGTEALRRTKISLTPPVINNLIERMTNRSHIILLPKMDLSSSLSLRSILAELGVKSLFDPESADLSPLTQGRRVSRPDAEMKRRNESFAVEDLESAYADYISSKNLTDLGIDQARMENPGIAAEDLFHVVRMSVDEKGGDRDTFPPLDSTLKFEVFNVDRPFLFLVRHNPTGNIWIWGSIRCPTPFNSTQST